MSFTWHDFDFNFIEFAIYAIILLELKINYSFSFYQKLIIFELKVLT